MADFPREELQRRLEELARSKPPQDLSSGAMCYSTAGPPEAAEYVCPVCKNKTWYALAAKPESVWSRLTGRVESPKETTKEAPMPERDAAMTRIQPRDTVGTDPVCMVEYGLPSCRRQLWECGAAELGIELDETEFCEHCRPGIDAPRLTLIVRGREGGHRVEGIDETDVALIAEFLQRKNTHVGDYGQEVPLQKHARRLAELLNLDDPTGGKKA